MALSLAAIELAIFCKRIVLPVFGWATITPLCPLPIGATISIILVEKFLSVVSNLIKSSAYKGVKLSK